MTVVTGNSTLHSAPGRDEELTVIEAMERNGDSGTLIYLDDAMRPTRLPYRELLDRAERIAASLAGTYGVSPGARVCLLGKTSPDLIAALLGIWRAGAVVTVVPVPRRAAPETVVTEIASRVAAAQAHLVLADTAISAIAAGQVPAKVVSFGDLTAQPGARPPAPPGPADLALLQFTSGSTSVPRAVAVRHGQLLANAYALYRGAEVMPGETFVTWLPMYHDMGIITLTGAIGYGLDTCVLATETFAARPSSWLEAISAYRGTMTAAPNFAYGLAARYLSISKSRFDLSALRCAINGAEPIDPVVLERFVAVAGEHGLSLTAPCPAYGLAEATLVVTQSPADQTYQTVTVDRDALERGIAAVPEPGQPGRTLVACGTPIPGTRVIVTDDDGAPQPDGRVGSIRVQGPGVVPCYWTPDGTPHPTALRDRDGRLVTGDLGFLHDGQLFICGRQKDMIIIGGRNLYPEDFEFAAERVPGVRLGNVMAFSLPDTERMVVVAEAAVRDDASPALAQEVRDCLTETLSYSPHEVVLVRPGTLPKTTSGKRQRQACRALYRQGSLAVRAVAPA
jgi:fatty-acyl-CoA synthase